MICRSKLLLMALSCLLGTTLLTGCQTTKAPSIQVREVVVTKQTPEGAVVQVDLIVQSENDFDIPIAQIGYKVAVEGLKPFSFPDVAPIDAIPPASEGRRIIPLEAAFATNGIDILGRAYKVTGVLAYEPPGAWAKAKKETGIPWPEVGFQASGVLDVR